MEDSPARSYARIIASVLILRISGAVTADWTIGRCSGLPLRASGGIATAATISHDHQGANAAMRTSASTITNASAPITTPRHPRVLRTVLCSARHSGLLPSTTAFDRR